MILIRVLVLFNDGAPIQVAWLYNIRGSDVPYCPVVHAFAIVTTDSAFFYVDVQKVSSEVSWRNRYP